MWEFIKDHFEGIIALALGGLIPVILYLFKIYRDNIIDVAEDKINGVTKRIDKEMSIIKEKMSVLKENIIHLQDKSEYQNESIKEQLTNIEEELKQLEVVEKELHANKELMLLQYNNFKEQLDDFKQFCKELLFK